MKRLGIITSIVIIFLATLTTPVLADDPPDMDVDIGIATPGDANVDIDVQAGGDLNVSVNGEGLATDQMVQDAYQNAINAIRNATSGGAINSHDWWRYKSKYLDPMFSELYQNAGITNDQLAATMGAVAKLIQETQSSAVIDNEQSAEIASISVGLVDTTARFDTTVGELKAQDDKTWNQLMYGAEYHLSLLDARESDDVNRLENYDDYLREGIDIAYQNHQSLNEYAVTVGVQYLLYIRVLAGLVALLVLALVIMTVFMVKHSHNRLAH